MTRTRRAAGAWRWGGVLAAAAAACSRGGGAGGAGGGERGAKEMEDGARRLVATLAKGDVATAGRYVVSEAECDVMFPHGGRRRAECPAKTTQARDTLPELAKDLAGFQPGRVEVRADVPGAPEGVRLVAEVLDARDERRKGVQFAAVKARGRWYFVPPLGKKVEATPPAQ